MTRVSGNISVHGAVLVDTQRPCMIPPLYSFSKHATFIAYFFLGSVFLETPPPQRIHPWHSVSGYAISIKYFLHGVGCVHILYRLVELQCVQTLFLHSLFPPRFHASSHAVPQLKCYTAQCFQIGHFHGLFLIRCGVSKHAIPSCVFAHRYRVSRQAASLAYFLHRSKSVNTPPPCAFQMPCRASKHATFMCISNTVPCF